LAYALPFGTSVGVSQYYYSGTPTTTEMRFQSAPIFPFGRNDIGRTPNITQTDLSLSHTVRFNRYGVTVGAMVSNIFDERKVTNIYPIASTTSIIIRDLSACGSGPVTVAACGPSANTPRIGPATGSANNPAQATAFFGGNVDWQRQFDRQVALGLIPDFRYKQPNTYQDPRDVRVYVRLTF